MKHLVEIEKNEHGGVHSLDGKRTISLEEFDRLFDEGSDEIDEFVDWSKARKLDPDEEMIPVYFHPSKLTALDHEAASEGISRAQLIERWIGERLEKKVAKPS